MRIALFDRVTDSLTEKEAFNKEHQEWAPGDSGGEQLSKDTLLLLLHSLLFLTCWLHLGSHLQGQIFLKPVKRPSASWRQAPLPTLQHPHLTGWSHNSCPPLPSFILSDLSVLSILCVATSFWGGGPSPYQEGNYHHFKLIVAVLTPLHITPLSMSLEYNLTVENSKSAGLFLRQMFLTDKRYQVKPVLHLLQDIMSKHNA